MIKRKIHWVFSLNDPRLNVYELERLSIKYDFEIDRDEMKIYVYRK